MHLVVGGNQEAQESHFRIVPRGYCTDLTHFVTSNIEVKTKPEMPMKKRSSPVILINEDEGKDTDQCEPHLRPPGVSPPPIVRDEEPKGSSDEYWRCFVFFFGYGSSLF